MVWLWRAGLVIVAALAAWKIVLHAVADFYVAQPGSENAHQALIWDPGHPRALLLEGLAAGDARQAEGLFVRAAKANPADAQPLLELARLAVQREGAEEADALVQQAVRLEPTSPGVLKPAVQHWRSVGLLPEAMACISVLLTQNTSELDTWFPVLRQAVEDPVLRPWLATLAAKPTPSWWSALFSRVAGQMPEMEPVRALFALRSASPDDVLPQERSAFVDRLMAEQLFPEAHEVWAEGLSDLEREQLALLYDGSFELGMQGNGFDWRIDQAASERVAADRTYGMRGDRALHLVFHADSASGAVLSQPLLLTPAHYRMTGMVRSEMPDSQSGVRWTARCRGAGDFLGRTEQFRGIGTWKPFTLEFTVPDGCAIQDLALVDEVEAAVAGEGIGGIWFDALSIERINGQEPHGDSAQTSLSNAATGTVTGD